MITTETRLGSDQLGSDQLGSDPITVHLASPCLPSLSTGYKALLLNWGWTRDRWSRGIHGRRVR